IQGGGKRLPPLPVAQHFFERVGRRRIFVGRRSLLDHVDVWAMPDKHLPVVYFALRFARRIVHGESWLTGDAHRDWAHEPVSAPVAPLGPRQTTSQGTGVTKRDRFPDDGHINDLAF